MEQPDLFTRNIPAFDGLADEVVDAIEAKVTPEMVHAFVSELSDEPLHADTVRGLLLNRPWFPSHTRPDTQRRFLRVLRDAAIEAGYPVCSMNDGLLLGTRDMVLKAAERARALGRGAFERAAALDRLARVMPEG
jgi:hypothetical protein